MNTLLQRIPLLSVLFWGIVTQAAQLPIILEAEDAKLFGELKVEQVSGFSGNKYVHDFHINSDSYYLYENIEVDQAGTYELKAFTTGTARPFYIKVNDYERIVLRTSDSPDWNAPPTSVSSAYIYLDAGTNVIKMGTEFENGPNIDKFEIHATSVKIEKPRKVTVAFPYDFTDEAEIMAEHSNATLAFLTDNNENTFYEVSGITETTITVDCKEDKVLTGMLLYAGRGVDVTKWKVEYSKDGQTWRQFRPASTRMIGMGDMALFTYNRVVTSSTYSARYYRLTATGTDNIRIAEWQLFGYAFDTAGKKPYFPADVTEGLNLEKQISGYPEGGTNEGIMQLFDKQLTTKYCALGTSFYVQCVLDKAYRFNSYTVTSANDASERDPKLWSLSGYNPEEGWIELDERRDFNFPGRYTTMKFQIDSEKEFTAFLLEVSSVHAGDRVQLANLQVFGEPTGGPAVAPEVPSTPSTDPRERASELVRLMTKGEKLSYVGGVDWMYTKAIPRLGIPQMKMSDGPQGVGTWGNSTAYPCGICLASTWNEDLAHSYGEALALDCRSRGVNILLGPAVNIHRAPMCGRNFEYMGEDPFLAARMCVPYIQGVQENGVAACVKHYALNNQEHWRNHIDVQVSDRALYEIYLPAFKAAIEEGKSWTIMGAYNKVRGTHAAHNKLLNNDILKGEWGFDGCVVTDWGAAHDTYEAAMYGLDLELGTFTNGLTSNSSLGHDSYYLGNAYLQMVKEGKVPMEVVNDKAARVLRLIFRTAMNDNGKLGAMSNDSHYETAYQIATEGIVLLKNEATFKGESLLPLSQGKYKRVLVVGDNAIRNLMQGGGSSELKPKMVITPLEALTEKLGKECVKFTQGYVAGRPMFDRADTFSQSVIDSLYTAAVNEAQKADLVIFMGGLNKNFQQDCEGDDRKTFQLPFEQDRLIKGLLKANKKVVVVLTSGNAVDMPWLKEVPSVIQSWYLGSIGGKALADVITGEVTPSGKLPFSYPAKLEDCPAHYYGEISYPGDGIRQEYKEDILVGYRWYDTKKIKPLFPFGYGLSYTQFEYGKPVVSSSQMQSGDVLEIKCTVRNVGKVAGKEVVQLYIGDEKCSVLRPLKELKDFYKVTLQPGEEKEVLFTIDEEDLKFFDDTQHKWVAESGKFKIYIGSSSKDIKGVVEFDYKN